VETMPLEPLLAAHAQGRMGATLPERIVSASEYSSEYKSRASN
jgi:hypothetical protein